MLCVRESLLMKSTRVPGVTWMFLGFTPAAVMVTVVAGVPVDGLVEDFLQSTASATKPRQMHRRVARVGATS